MKVHHQFNHFSLSSTPLAVTIGNFDGVHLGHQALLHRLKQVAPRRVVVTFSNHPSEIIHKTAISHLTTLAHRLNLFEKMGIDETILIPFTEEFAKQTAKEFLMELKRFIGFTYLILGHDAVIGHDRNGDLSSLCEELCFRVEYLEAVRNRGKIVSSSEIRKCIQTGKLREAGTLLGRPYSIFATVSRGHGNGGLLGFHTANLPVEKLSLPPLGVYAVSVKIGQATLPAVANLGYAPTLHQNRPPCLEVHLIDEKRDLYGQEIEVFFLHYLRPEKRFEGLDALKNQIQKDIVAAKKFF
jgi:riboflavin kinase / FMN adenylyltransferase